MNQKIVVFGLASKKIVKELTLPKQFPPDLSLLDFLMEHRITIASSCNGAGTCRKCIVNFEILSCQVTLLDFVKNNPVSTVEVSYL